MRSKKNYFDVAIYTLFDQQLYEISFLALYLYKECQFKHCERQVSLQDVSLPMAPLVGCDREH